MGKSRRRFIKIGIGFGLLLIGYFAWLKLYKPKTLEIGEEEKPSKPETISEDEVEEELDIEFTQHPHDSPLGHSSPYLILEPISVNVENGITFMVFNCHNMGGASSTAVLEVYRIDGELQFPLNISSLPRVYNTTIYLSPGTSRPVHVNAATTEDTLGFLVIISDPLLDSCPRIYNSPSDMEAFSRHFAYYGR